MACHVAILRLPYIRLILAGTKTVESRLSKSAMPPHGRVAPGDRLFIKASGGPFMATAIADRVQSFDHLTPDDLVKLKARFNPRVCGDDAYWQMKGNSRFATFIDLCDVQSCDVGPAYTRSAYKAWFTLPDHASPLLDVPLTAGAVRNRYVTVNARPAFFGNQPFMLHLPDGQTVQTTLYQNHRLAWRGWAPYFKAHNVTAGDRVRFVAMADQRYRVQFVHGTIQHDRQQAKA